MGMKSEWYSPAALIPLGIAVLALGYTVFYRLPDLEEKIDQYRNEQKSNAAEWQKQQLDRFDKVETQLVNVRTNLLRLCSRTGKPDKDCQIKELVSSASDAGTFNSRMISEARIASLQGKTPKIDSSEAQKQLETILNFPATQRTFSNKKEIASLVAWSSAAKDAKWSVADGDLLVKFANGSAVFTPDVDVSSVKLSLVANELNAVSASFQAATFPLEDSTSIDGQVPDAK